MNKIELIHKSKTLPPASAWEKELYEFVNRWVDDSAEIEVRTSGSTGLPKLIRHRKEAMRESARMTCDFLGLQPGMKALLCLSTRNIAGMMMVVRAFERDLEILAVNPGSHPLKEMHSAGSIKSKTSKPEIIDFCAMVPAQLFNSLQDPSERAMLISIRNLIIGGAPVSYTLEQQIRHISGNVYLTFGMTETMSHIALRKLNGAEASDEFTLLEGITIETGEAGNLIIHAPYLSAEPIITNDLAEITGRRTFKWLGRQDHVINNGGFKIIPELTESRMAGVMSRFLENDGHSTQRYFIGSIPDEKLGEVPVLVIEMPVPENKDQLSKEILTALTTILPRHELPREVYYISKFIETPTGKIIRSATLVKRIEMGRK